MSTIVAPAARTACDHLVVALRAARLDDPGDAGLERSLRAVGKREERIGREHGAANVVAVLLRFLQRELDGVDAARLAAADADRREILRQHDRVRTDVLAHPPREHEVAPACLVRIAAGDLHRFAVVDVPVAILHEQAAEDALEVALGRGRSRAVHGRGGSGSPLCVAVPRGPCSS